MRNSDRPAYQRAVRTGKAVFLRCERQDGWRTALPIYVLWCGGCRRYTESHPTGYAGKVCCGTCRRFDRPMTAERFHEEIAGPFLRIAPIALMVAAILVLLWLRLWR